VYSGVSNDTATWLCAGLHLLDDADEVGRIRQIAVVQMQPDAVLVWILIKMIDPVGIERGGAALDTVDFVAFGEQQLGEVGTVLAGDS
jgi:hypothetical protein